MKYGEFVTQQARKVNEFKDLVKWYLCGGFHNNEILNNRIGDIIDARIHAVKEIEYNYYDELAAAQVKKRLIKEYNKLERQLEKLKNV